ncbi:probable manganese-transporting ATPase PDR2 isoform X1 [Phragmites australis]|uniref:probable manganese-transporting ATPase PDR2 isoform X1 n=1 Tax=Phragmites australis TaxID=29695 RepID=UPI002D786722|nr:probable manganese-transporting ATPase PDR2 isoform X1 [Phragmites australis]
MARFEVNGKSVQGVDLLRRRYWPSRLDFWPFLALYVLWLLLAVPALDFTDSLIILAALSAAHILAFLFTAWSVDFRAFVGYSKASRLSTLNPSSQHCLGGLVFRAERLSLASVQVKVIHASNACKVTPAKFSGSKEIVPLHIQRTVASSSAAGETEEIYFDFRKQRFIYSAEKDNFLKLRYPTKELLGHYTKATGYGTEAKINTAVDKWGRNIFEYPQPTFQKLMKEQCMEPFFVFQVFCVGLWCLDDFWYYSLFTLFMLFLFESTMAKNRLKTLTELRRVKVDNQIVLTYRCGKWVKISGTELLPGDIVSIGRSASGEDRSVPADMLLLAGSAIANEAILTGESTPQWKVSIAGRGPEEMLSVKRDKNHILFGGTKILQHTADKSINLRAPDGGCVAFVLRTGFETSQGKLMRTILFSTERVTANNKESGLFILFLLFFAIIASGYVLMKGLEDPTRSRYKLILSCSLIITSVIPPELPMELSIAVNTSLIALARRGIFCTEPFRIPFAGKVDICCFDKTGTLTSDDMEFQGVVTLEGDEELISDANKVPLRTQEVLSSCHALVFVDNKLVGDPLEKAAIKGIDWIYTSDEKAMCKKPGGQPVQIVHRYHFASHLKRMSVIVRIQEKFYAFIKGAPETIQERLVDLPAAYVETYKKYTRQGSRVLALAYKLLPEIPVSEARSLERDQVESDLTFAGFAVFNCPIRNDSGTVLRELGQSSHDLVMITGDQALTACHVASQVHISSKPVLILTRMKTGGFEWVSPDETDRAPYSAEVVAVLSESHDLCINGDCFEMLQRTDAVLQVIPYVKVFARVAPEQKELVLTTFKSVGRVTIMCGDGTNDVGALKQAHVGIALLNAEPVQKADSKSQPQSSKAENKSGKLKKQKLANEASSQLTPPANTARASSSRPLTAAERQREKLQKMLDEMNDESDGRSTPIVKLGDASMASPFTAKHASVAPTLDIIRQGRSTLVTTLQMFKILGLNCLATAYVLSVMYLDGVKLGDVQATISGVFTAAFFLFISHARPLQTLSAERPHPNIFCAYVLLSILGQFAMHLFFLITAVNEASKYMPEECIEPDSDFHPNLVNTVSYMVNMMIQVATFAVNYMGHPFNQSISENKPFKYALYGAVAFFTVITSDMFRDLNDYMKLEPLPEGMRGKLMLWAILMFCGCYGWERLLRWAFPGKMPAWEKRQKQAVANLEKKHD